MALTLGSCALVNSNPAQPYQTYAFTIILDGAATSATGLTMPTGFPSFASATGPAAGNTAAATSAAKRVIFRPGCGGTSATVSAAKVNVNSSNPTTQLDVGVSAAGTNTQTVQVFADVYDQAF